MKDDITRNVFANICEDFKEVLIVGIEENKEQFPYSIACINFIFNLKEQGINKYELGREGFLKECWKWTD